MNDSPLDCESSLSPCTASRDRTWPSEAVSSGPLCMASVAQAAVQDPGPAASCQLNARPAPQRDVKQLSI